MRRTDIYLRPSIASTLHRLSDRALAQQERLLEVRMQNIARFSPWPALEASLLKDIEILREEIKNRERNNLPKLKLKGK
jgi:hypothetical protein